MEVVYSLDNGSFKASYFFGSPARLAVTCEFFPHNGNIKFTPAYEFKKDMQPDMAFYLRICHKFISLVNKMFGSQELSRMDMISKLENG